MTNHRPNMALENRTLLRWFASKNPIWVIIKMIPFIALYLIVFVSHWEATFHILTFFFLGILTWSLFEYITHRWVYHIHIKSSKLAWFIDAFHHHHHKNLQDYEVLNAGFLLNYPISIFFLALVYLLSDNPLLTAAFGVGATLYYIFYEFVHYYIHYRPYTSGYMAFIQRYHLFHHYKNWNKNFGNTTSFWDRIFGSYDANHTQFKLSEQQLRDLIK